MYTVIVVCINLSDEKRATKDRGHRRCYDVAVAVSVERHVATVATISSLSSTVTVLLVLPVK